MQTTDQSLAYAPPLSSGVLSAPQAKSSNIETSVFLMRYRAGWLAMFSSAKNQLEQQINSYNQRGYRLRHVLPARMSGPEILLSLLLFIVTFGFYTRTSGETLIFEKVD
jgi:hypothetical protein